MPISSLSPATNTSTYAFSPDTKAASLAQAQKLIFNSNVPLAQWEPINTHPILAGRIHPSRSAVDLSLLTEESVGDGAHTQTFKAPFVTIDRQGKIRHVEDWVRLDITDEFIQPQMIEKTLSNQQKAYALKGRKGHIAPPPQKMTERQFLQPHLGKDLWYVNNEDEIPTANGRRAARPLDRAARNECLLQTALGIQECHFVNLIHGDIKQENVMARIDHRGRIRIQLIDFGDSTTPTEANRHLPNWREFWTTTTQNGMPLTFADDIFGLGCLIADMTFPSLSLHYCRNYLKWSQQDLENHIDNAVEDSQDQPLADLIKKIFVADQQWTQKALREHIAYVVFATLTSPDKEFNIDDYHALIPALQNKWRSLFLEPEKFFEFSMDEQYQKVLEIFKPDCLIKDCDGWQADLEYYREEIEAAFPSLDEVIKQLQSFRCMDQPPQSQVK